MTKVINLNRKSFTISSNAITTDLSLSDGAFRVYMYMASKPDDWQFNNRDIQNKLGIKRAETIAKYWRELFQSGWISRTPVLTESGKPSGYFDYILNFEPQIPTTQNAEVVPPTTDKPYTENQQIRKNRSYTNKDSISNKENNNTPIPHKIKTVGGGCIWLIIAKNLKLSFNDDEQAAITLWFNYSASKQKSTTTDLQVETNLKNLAKIKADGYDICSLINDTISAGYKWLLKPSAIYLTANNYINNKQTKQVKPHLYSNPEYIIPETPAQKSQLARYIQSCYKQKISPKSKLPLSDEERSILDAHYAYVSSQPKNANGFFTTYATWHDYILREEVYTGVSLLDQPIAAKPAVVDGTITQLANASRI